MNTKSNAIPGDVDERPPGFSTEDLPGYPPYPPSEDMMSGNSLVERISTDVEQFSNLDQLGHKEAPVMENEIPIHSGYGSSNRKNEETGEDDDQLFVPGTEADVTKEEWAALGDPDQDADEGDDEFFKRRGVDPVESEEELDIPGAELDDEQEKIGSEDEENNYYSLGDDEKSDQDD